MVGSLERKQLMPKQFNRGISEAFVQALNCEYEKDGWWTRLVSDKRLFVGIRENCLNVYYKGASVLELRYIEGRFVGRSHFKYLLNQTTDRRSDYVQFTDGEFAPVAVKESYRDLAVDIGRIKNSAALHQGAEKHGVHDIACENENVIDVEIAVPDERGRMDFTALRNEDNELRLIFYEAKLYRELNVGNIVGQVEEYQEILSRRKEEIEESYRCVRANLCALEGYSRRGLEQGDFTVNPEVRVVVFEFDQDQQKAANAPTGKFHRLRDRLGRHRVLTKGDTKKFLTGISR